MREEVRQRRLWGRVSSAFFTGAIEITIPLGGTFESMPQEIQMLVRGKPDSEVS